MKKNVTVKALDLDAALELVAKNLRPVAMKNDEQTSDTPCSVGASCDNTNSHCFEE